MMQELGMRERIIVTAMRLYGRHGFDDVTNQELAFESNVPVNAIMDIFTTKDAIFDAVVDYIPTSVLEHYEPSRQEILQLLRINTPTQVLSRFAKYYAPSNDGLWFDMCRFIFMERHRSVELDEMAYRQVFIPLWENAAKTIDLLIELEKIPPCDSWGIARMWALYTYLYFRRATQEEMRADILEYLEVSQLFFGLATGDMEELNLDYPFVALHPIKEDRWSTPGTFARGAGFF